MIRQATLDDLPAVYRLGLQFQAQDNVATRTTVENWGATWARALDSGKGAIFLQTNGTAEPIGGIGGGVFTSPNNGETEAREAFWYVDPDHRGGGAGLLEAFEDWAEGLGARRIWMVRLHGWRDRQMDRFYQRKGYESVETVYRKEVERG